MENLLCIKGKIIGKGKPLVCVPVMESSKEEILRETRRLEEAHTEMIESYIEEGNQSIGDHIYGKSITDPCLGWEDSKQLIYDIAEMNAK